MISIIMPTCCRGGNGLLKRAIESVLNQTYRDFEFIIVDDGSVDETEHVVHSYKDPRIRYIRHRTRSGIPAKRVNEGIRLARGEFVAFQFDDDVWAPKHLQVTVETLENLPQDYGMVFTLVGRTIVTTGAYDLLGIHFTPENELHDNHIGNNSVLIRMRVLRIIGGYDEDPGMRRLCDWDLWKRVLRASYKIHPIKAVTAYNFASYPDSLDQNVPLEVEYMQNRMSSDRTEYLRSLVIPYDPDNVLTKEAREKGFLLKGDESPGVYFVAWGYKHLIADEETMARLGFRWDDVQVMPQSFLHLLPNGVILRG